MRLETTHLFQEIHEQPTVLERFLQREQATAKALAQAIRERGITHVVIAARGTSDNAARYAKYVLGAMNGLSVGLATPSLFSIYKKPPRFGNALVIGISQSGKSPDIVGVVVEARRQGVLTAVITNIPDSDLAKHGDFVIPLHAGEELAVAATKTYTSELAAIALLGAALSGDGAMLTDLHQIPTYMNQVLNVSSEIGRLVERYRYMRACVVVGRGFNYATAFELALKMKELTYTMVEPYSSADFMHGPLALVEQAFPAIVIAPSGGMLSEMQAFIRTLNERGAETIIISDDAETLNWGRTPLELGTAVLFAALPTLIPEPINLAVNSFHIAILLLIIVIDLENKLILNIVTFPATILAVLGSFLVTPDQNNWKLSLVGAAVGFVVFYLFYWFGQWLFGDGALGYGDVKLSMAMGAMLGFHRIFFALMVAIVLGGVISFLILLINRKINARTYLPYGQYLAIAGIVMLIWGVQVFQWYTN